MYLEQEIQEKKNRHHCDWQQTFEQYNCSCHLKMTCSSMWIKPGTKAPNLPELMVSDQDWVDFHSSEDNA